VALAEQKEQQGLRLETLRVQRQADELKRQQEIENLRNKAIETRREQIEADLAKYKKIAFSKYAQEIKPTAWSALLASYPEAKGIPQYDENAFRKAVGLGSIHPAPMDSEYSASAAAASQTSGIGFLGDASFKRVKSRGSLTIGLDDAFPPMGFRTEDGTLIGFDIDAAEEVGKRLGIKINWQPTAWDGVMHSLNA
jgi:hypothetical protein